jgi:hypothetical protein
MVTWRTTDAKTTSEGDDLVMAEEKIRVTMQQVDKCEMQLPNPGLGAGVE